MKLSETDVTSIEEGLHDALLGKTLKVDPRSQGPAIQKLDHRAPRRRRRRGEGGRRRLPRRGRRGSRAPRRRAPVSSTRASPTGTGARAEGDRSREGPLQGDAPRRHASSTARPRAASPRVFHLNRVVPCWTEGVQKMKVGGKAKLTCPAEPRLRRARRPGPHPGRRAARLRGGAARDRAGGRGARPAPSLRRRRSRPTKPAAKPAAKPAPKPARLAGSAVGARQEPEEAEGTERRREPVRRDPALALGEEPLREPAEGE